jgi:hypothetical protein
VSVREDPLPLAGPCSACGHNVVDGVCVACDTSVASTTEAKAPPEPPEKPTHIPLPPPRPPINFTLSAPPRFGITAPTEGCSAPAATPRVLLDVAERVSRLRAAGLVICAVFALTFPVFVAPFWNLASPDPLSEFSAITGPAASDAQIEDWSRRQFAASDGLNTTGRIVRARSALEQRMSAAIARDAGRPMDWGQVASWANIARALGVHDKDMLELAADLNVQVAIHDSEIPEIDVLERLARARSLLQMRSEASRDCSEVMRIERKLSDLDELEMKIRENRRGQR